LVLIANASLAENDLRNAWAAFLGKYYWEWMGTFTFRDGAVHPEAADKRFRLLVSMANRTLHGPRWAKKGRGISWARGLEKQRRGAVHFHALLSGVGQLRRLTYMDIWDRIAGFARIERPRSQEFVMRYISKYVVKGGDIDLGGPWFSGIDRGPKLPFDP